MKFHNLGFPEAVEALARDAGMEVPRQETPADARRGAEQRALFECLEQASKYYQGQLRRHPQRGRAVDWCKSRGISGVTAREFQLGYAPPGWENLLKELGADEKAQGKLLKAGLIIARDAEKKADSGRSPFYDRFRDRVLFPIRDSRGRTVGFGGRVLDDGHAEIPQQPGNAGISERARVVRPVRGAQEQGRQVDARGRLHGRHRTGPGRHQKRRGHIGNEPRAHGRSSACSGTRRKSCSVSTATMPAGGRPGVRSKQACR